MVREKHLIRCLCAIRGGTQSPWVPFTNALRRVVTKQHLEGIGISETLAISLS